MAKPPKPQNPTHKPQTPNGVGLMHEPQHSRYRVRVGKKFLGKNAKPYTRYFASEKEALKFVAGLKKKESGDFKSAEALGITLTQMAEIRAALQLLEGTPILKAVNGWLEAQKQTTKVSPTVAEAIKKLLQLKASKGIGDRHRFELEEKLKAILFPHLETQIHEITFDQMLDRIEAPAGKKPNQTSPSQSQKNKRIRYSNILFRFAITQNWITQSPNLAFGKTENQRSKVVVLTPKQTAGLLHHCQLLRPELLVSIALKCFSGVRNSELFKLRWENIGDEIIVPASYSKTGRDRKVTIPGALRNWLDAIIKTQKPTPNDLVCPIPEPQSTNKTPSWKRQSDAWYKRIRPVAKAAGLHPWNQNALRHLFGSYHLGLHGNEGETATQMGNSIAVVRANYTDAVREAACNEFWSLTRSKVTELVNGNPEEPQNEELEPRKVDRDLD